MDHEDSDSRMALQLSETRLRPDSSLSKLLATTTSSVGNESGLEAVPTVRARKKTVS